MNREEIIQRIKEIQKMCDVTEEGEVPNGREIVYLLDELMEELEED